MNKTPIEWCDFTVNPFRFRNLETGKIGHHCSKISPGCKNCYSSKMQEGPYLSGLAFIETNKPKGEFFLDEGALEQVLRRKKPARIFWCDMTDMFLEDYPGEWIDRCFAVMALTPQHTHLVLTKRPDRMREYFCGEIPLSSREELIVAQAAHTGKVVWDARGSDRVNYFGCGRIGDVSNRRVWPGWPLPNVHLGVSVEDQQRANERYEPMRALAQQSWTTWVSYEPALELVQWWGWSFLKWMVIGGESGPDARPFDLAWAGSAIMQCRAAGVPPFVKQLGAKPTLDGSPYDPYGTYPPRTYSRKGGNPNEWPEDLRIREYPEAR